MIHLPLGLTWRRRSTDGFDFTQHMRALCSDVAARLPEYRHIDMDRVAIRYCQARKSVRHGLQATLTPLRFAGGSLSIKRGRRNWTIQRLYNTCGTEVLYILSFYLPRFLDMSYQDKLNTVFHELWHIGPKFDGDMRRHPGRCYAHTHSQRQYDAEMASLAACWLALRPPREVHEFLRHNFAELRRRHGVVVGTRLPEPKLIPLD